ncbi:MAG: hypothetical protein ABMA13_22655 [Chthoniobacteraceae bacterium]
MPNSDYLDALVDYRVMFPTLESLGAGTPPIAWEAERLKARAALDAILATSVQLEGGGISGFRQFAQQHKLRAIYAVRAELDEDYVNPYTIEANDPLPGRRIGSVVET